MKDEGCKEARKILLGFWQTQTFTNEKVCRLAEIYGLDHLDEDFNIVVVSVADRDYNILEAEKELCELQERVFSSTPNPARGAKRCCA